VPTAPSCARNQCGFRSVRAAPDCNDAPNADRDSSHQCAPRPSPCLACALCPPLMLLLLAVAVHVEAHILFTQVPWSTICTVDAPHQHHKWVAATPATQLLNSLPPAQVLRTTTYTQCTLAHIHAPQTGRLFAAGSREGVFVCDTLSTSCGGFGSRALARFPQQPPALELVPVQHGAEGLCARGGARGETTAGGRPFARVHQVHTRACVCYPAHSSRMSMPSGVTQARKEKVERWSSLPLFLRTLLAPLPMFVHTSLYDGPAHPVVLTEAITSWPASKVRLLAAGVGCRASSTPPASPLSHPFPPLPS
jgi:hypothetical protein